MAKGKFSFLTANNQWDEDSIPNDPDNGKCYQLGKGTTAVQNGTDEVANLYSDPVCNNPLKVPNRTIAAKSSQNLGVLTIAQSVKFGRVM